MEKKTKISFGLNKEVDAVYAVVDANALQPSHLGAIENPYHFLPESQPRNRAISNSGAKTPEIIASNLRPAEIIEGATAYSGAPICNKRGEVIQGNGRAYTMRFYYDQFEGDPRGYFNYLTANENFYGFKNLKKALNEINIYNPVLVRIVNVDDNDAIKLGQYKQTDLEAIALKTNDAKSRTQMVDDDKLSAVLTNIFGNSDANNTLSDIIRSSNIISQFVRIGLFRPDDIERFTKNGKVNSYGVSEITNVLMSYIFKGFNTNIPEYFVELSQRQQNALLKCLPLLLKMPQSTSIKAEISATILGLRELEKSGMDYNLWAAQLSAFEAAPSERYSNLEMALIKLFDGAKTQIEVVKKIEQYKNLVNDKAANLIDKAENGKSKNEAVEIVFGIKPKIMQGMEANGMPNKKTGRAFEQKEVTRERPKTRKKSKEKENAQSKYVSQGESEGKLKDEIMQIQECIESKTKKRKPRSNITKVKPNTAVRESKPETAKQRETQAQLRAMIKDEIGLKNGYEKQIKINAAMRKTLIKVLDKQEQSGLAGVPDAEKKLKKQLNEYRNLNSIYKAILSRDRRYFTALKNKVKAADLLTESVVKSFSKIDYEFAQAKGRETNKGSGIKGFFDRIFG